MRVNILSVKMAGVVATLAVALILLPAVDGASAKTPVRASMNHLQSVNHPAVAKNDHGHRRHGRELRFSQLSDRPVYCNCSYESCPEWVVVQCVGYRPRNARPATLAPRCICSTSDLTDPDYD